MKTLVIYYSLTGNTRFIAEQIAQKSGADILELKPERGQGSKSRPKPLPLTKDLADYDLIILGTPVWGFNFAPAIRTFLNQAKLENKKLALFVCHEDLPAKTLASLENALAGNQIIGKTLFSEPLKNPTGTKEKATKWLESITPT
ncbi:MAG: flavodoxin domain-containing protein [Patescibacteria group bacterium]